MPGIRRIHRLLSSHRRITALGGVILILGVVALNAHEALPEHHHQGGETTVCVAALSIAVLAAFGWRPKRPPAPGERVLCALLPRLASTLSAPPMWSNARAGPARRPVLRR